VAPHKTRFLTSPARKLLNLKGEWMVMRDGQFTAIRAVAAGEFRPVLWQEKTDSFLAGEDACDGPID
jgi:hypothetical protein